MDEFDFGAFIGGYDTFAVSKNTQKSSFSLHYELTANHCSGSVV